jgi:hypothetical protein
MLRFSILIAASVTIRRASRGHSDRTLTERKSAYEKVRNRAKTRQIEHARSDPRNHEPSAGFRPALIEHLKILRRELGKWRAAPLSIGKIWEPGGLFRTQIERHRLHPLCHLYHELRSRRAGISDGKQVFHSLTGSTGRRLNFFPVHNESFLFGRFRFCD